MFASCANNSDSDDRNPENPSPSLPANVGQNPIQNKITLKYSDYATLVMKTDGTAEYYDDDELEYVFKYTWDTTKKEIYMALGKNAYWNMGGKSQLLTYDQILSKIKEDYTVENMRNYNRTYYEEIKGKDWFKDEYPDCDTYEKFEKAFIEDTGCSSFEDFVKTTKQEDENSCKAMFGALITFSYEVNENDKITLTEKFTGIKNFLLYETCYYEKDGTRVEIEFGKEVSIERKVGDKTEYWYGEFGTGNRIEFEKEDSGDKKPGSYTEDIAKETVTVSFDGKDYDCKFRGINFIQADD
ncbi:MAG: hypothetical protein K2F89_09235 [Treponemataceae bacterium]|nr:hypothetical protein [Treponemataceae bacterium]